jgi:peptide/nickel transport system substrate-binding protein
MRSNKFLLLSLFVFTALLLAACGGAATEPAGQDTPPAPTESGGAADTPSAPASDDDLMLDPANATSDNARAAVAYLYEGLMRMDGDNPVPALAESYTVSEDRLDYIFNLRPGVTFHDGSTLNADVVIANFNRWFDPNDPNRGSGEFAAWVENFGGFKGEVTEDGAPKSHFDGIEKVNDLIVLVHLNREDPDFLKKMADPAFSIVSLGAFSGGDGGSGPYRFVSLSGSTITIEPFPGYWDPNAIPSNGMEVPIE